MSALDPTASSAGEEEVRLLQQAVQLAAENGDQQQLPFGALVVRDGQIVATGVNTALRDLDPTAHAEVEAIRNACKLLQGLDLSGATIYSSCEPCAICQSVAVTVGVSEIVYAAAKELVPDLRYPSGVDPQLAASFQAVLRQANPAGVRLVPTPGADVPFHRYLATVAG